MQTDLHRALLNEVNDSVLVSENNRCESIMKLEAMIKQFVNKATGGDLKSIKLVHDLLEHWDHRSRRPICFLVRPEDP